MDVVEVWIIVSLVGTTVSGWNLLDAIYDLRALAGIANGRRLIARGQVRREAIRTGVQATWLLVGLLVHFNTWSWSIVLLLIGTNFAMSAGSFFDGIDRKRLRNLLDGKKP